MSHMLSTGVAASDAELISAVRSGDTEAYGELFGRHRDAATRLSRQLVSGPDADDLVSESFVRVLAVLQDGKGPDESFRAYLLTAIRRLHIDRIRASKRVKTTDDEAELDRHVEFVDTATMRFEQSAAAEAFASLPERWQLVLWHLDVEGQKPADIAPLLAMSPNSVSALAYRAREGLRQAYLQSHLAPTLYEGCRRTTGMLGTYVRKGLSSRDTATVEAHLDECSRCTGLYLELAEVNSNLSGILAPALLGTAAAGYLSAGGVAGFAGAGAALTVKGLVGNAARTAFEPVKAVATGAGAQGIVVAAVVVGLATVGTIAATTDFGGKADRRNIAAPASTPQPSIAPGPSTSAEPTPTPTPIEPTPAAVQPVDPVPADDAPTEPLPRTATAPEADPAPDPEPKPDPDPEPTPARPAPTDYGIGAVRITNDSALLQRRFTIPITARTTGRAVSQTVTLRVDFRRRVMFRGVASPGWDCGSATRTRRLSSLVCTKRLPAGQGETFVATFRGIALSGVISVAAERDPNRTNDSVSFRSGLWVPL